MCPVVNTQNPQLRVIDFAGLNFFYYIIKNINIIYNQFRIK
jgi:hypothetical protein